MKNLLLPKFLKISTAGKVEWELNVPDHGELTAIAATDSVYSLGKHIIDRFNRSDASISKTSLNGEFICNKTMVILAEESTSYWVWTELLQAEYLMSAVV